MNNETLNIKQIHEEGIIKVKKLLSSTELELVKNIINKNLVEKNDSKSYYSTNFFQLLMKIHNLKKFRDHLYLINLAKKKKLNIISNQVFNKQTKLRFVDAYKNEINNTNHLPWHTDQAYHETKKTTTTSGFVNPDKWHLKFFIYLTDVGPDNGCMSYIPKSHKIGYALIKGIFEKKIKYQKYWSLKDFRNIISDKNNKDYIINQIEDQNIFEEFLKDTEFAEKNLDTKKFDYSLKAGDAIIFNEGGVHKASQSKLSERLVLRYLYK